MVADGAQRSAEDEDRKGHPDQVIDGNRRLDKTWKQENQEGRTETGRKEAQTRKQ